MKKIFFFIFTLFFIHNTNSQTVTVTGGWAFTLASTNLTEAGNDYPAGSTLSAATQTTVTVNSSPGTIAFVYVQKSDTSWDSRLTISARRTGPGSGNANTTVTNGTTFQILTNTPQYFFTVSIGAGNKVSNIPIQYSISGYTVLLPVKAYTTVLLYTVTN